MSIVPSAISPVRHGSDLPLSEPDGNMEYCPDPEHSDGTAVAGDNIYKPERSNQPVPLTQNSAT